jgi:hypothetical protein
MSAIWDRLVALRDRLATVPGVATCRIGLEPEIAPEDYPIIRIVPTRLVDVDAAHCGRRRAECLIYFGRPLHAETDGGVEGVTLRLLEMEAAIVAMFRPAPGWKAKYLETITDEDRIAAYKLMAVRCEVED